MENRKKFIPFLIASLIIHLIGFLCFFFQKTQPTFLSNAIDVSFYSPSEEKSEIQSFSQEISAVKPQETQEEIKKEEPIVKEEVLQEPQTLEEEAAIVKAQPIQDDKKSKTAQNSAATLNKVSAVNKQEKRYTIQGAQYDGVAFDNDNFQYAYYTNTIVRSISNYWTWSESYAKLKAVIFFRILKNGTVTSIEIKDSSGNKRFDENALNAVKRAGQFAPLPQGYKPDSLGVYFEFKYRG
jgi:TonB family protein